MLTWVWKVRIADDTNKKDYTDLRNKTFDTPRRIKGFPQKILIFREVFLHPPHYPKFPP
jgi:hypothetical protein